MKHNSLRSRQKIPSTFWHILNPSVYFQYQNKSLHLNPFRCKDIHLPFMTNFVNLVKRGKGFMVIIIVIHPLGSLSVLVNSQDILKGQYILIVNITLTIIFKICLTVNIKSIFYPSLLQNSAGPRLNSLELWDQQTKEGRKRTSGFVQSGETDTAATKNISSRGYKRTEKGNWWWK